MRHKIFNYIKTYQGYIFNVSGGSFFKGQNKFPRKPASLIYMVGLNTSFEVFFGFFCQSYRKTNKHEQTWWIEIGKDNRKDDDELLLLLLRQKLNWIISLRYICRRTINFVVYKAGRDLYLYWIWIVISPEFTQTSFKYSEKKLMKLF